MTKAEVSAWHLKIAEARTRGRKTDKDQRAVYQSNRCLALLRAVLNHGDITPNPCSGVNLFKEVSVAQCLRQVEEQIAQLEASHPGDEVPLELQRYSVGYIAQTLQISPHGVRILMNDCGVKFAGSRNGIPELDGVGFHNIANEIFQIRVAVAQEKKAKQEAAQ